MQNQYSVLDYRVDLYFHDYKLAIEVDEYDHCDRNIDYEIKRKKAIKKEPGCAFIRINPDEQNHNIFKAFNEIHSHVKKSTKESLIDKIVSNPKYDRYQRGLVSMLYKVFDKKSTGFLIHAKSTTCK